VTSIIAIEASSPELEGSQKDLNFFLIRQQVLCPGVAENL